MEKYPSGRRGAPAKGVVRVSVARVQIPLSPPRIHRNSARIKVDSLYYENSRRAIRLTAWGTFRSRSDLARNCIKRKKPQATVPAALPYGLYGKANPDFSGARCRGFCRRIGNSPVILFAAANNGALAAVLQKRPVPARPASSRWTCAQRENRSVPEDSYKRKCRLYSTTCSILH